MEDRQERAGRPIQIADKRRTLRQAGTETETRHADSEDRQMRLRQTAGGQVRRGQTRTDETGRADKAETRGHEDKLADAPGHRRAYTGRQGRRR